MKVYTLNITYATDCISLINVSHLSSVDPETNVPSKINFNYFNINDFHSSLELQTSCLQRCLSVFNCNVSIQANFDKTNY